MNPSRQSGSSLVSTLVGLLLAVLTAGAMLVAYRATVSVSMGAQRSAVRDGQAASALLAAQIELQQAGFGMNPAEGTNVFVDTSDRRIVWRYRDAVGDATFLCSGLQLVIGTAADGIYRLTPVACTTAQNHPDWDVDERQLLASDAVLFEPPDADEKRNYNLSTARFRLATNQSCGPFGIASTAVLRTLVVMEDTAPDPDVTIFSYCLTNP